CVDACLSADFNKPGHCPEHFNQPCPCSTQLALMPVRVIQNAREQTNAAHTAVVSLANVRRDSTYFQDCQLYQPTWQ
ncbi:hypothetical protein L9F63_009840, partial [Diploptera punctata]